MATATRKFPPLKQFKNVDSIKGISATEADPNVTYCFKDANGYVRLGVVTTRPRWIFLFPDSKKAVPEYSNNPEYMAACKYNAKLMEEKHKVKAEKIAAEKAVKAKEREAKKVAKKLARNAAKIATLEAENKALK